MGSPVNPIVAICTWSILKVKPSVQLLSPTLWMRYVDHTFFIQQEEDKQIFLQHINKVDNKVYSGK